MGVHGLWTLLSPAGRKVKVEALNGQILAIDISIWVLQMFYGFISAGSHEFRNVHLLGVFRRIVKLLIHGIKPVFVFDGKPPELKRQTLIQRMQIRERRQVNLKKLAERYIVKRLELHAKQINRGEAGDSGEKVQVFKKRKSTQDEEEEYINNLEDFLDDADQEVNEFEKLHLEHQNEIVNYEFQMLLEVYPEL